MSVYAIFFIIFTEEEEFVKMRKNTEEHILEYAMQGLRTLCMARKVMRAFMCF